MTIRAPREDGAWWMALMCWLAGWVAAWRAAWEPFLVALAIVGLLYAAQALRTARRLWSPDPARARLQAGVAAACMVPPLSAFAWLISRWENSVWIALLGIPTALYGILILVSSERHPAARILGVVTLTAIAPATYAAATGGFGRIAALLWITLGGYFLLASVFVMARFRRSRPALWAVRFICPLVVGTAALFALQGTVHWALAGAFCLLGARVWLHDPAGPAADPRRIGNLELAHGATATVMTLFAIHLASVI